MMNQRYFEYLCGLIHADNIYNYGKLLTRLHEIPYIWYISNDENRSLAGRNLRRMFILDNGMSISLLRPLNEDVDWDMGMFDRDDIVQTCSVLEFLVGLAKEWEDKLSFNSDYGDRTPHWFWGHMIRNLGLDKMDNVRYNEHYINTIIDSMLHRRYNWEGQGNIFTIPGFDMDMAQIEVWWQLTNYINWLISEGLEDL